MRKVWIERRRYTGARRFALLLGVVVPLLALPACRSRTVPGTQGTNVGMGETLHGRLVEGRPSQSFTFEGVESSVLEFNLVSDEGSLAAPQVALLDPEGQSVDLAPHMQSPEGAATVKVAGVVLLRTGTYQVTVTPTIPCEPVYYRFSHCLFFPDMRDVPVTLTASNSYPVYVSAPRGGRVTVIVKPRRGSDLAPQFTAVEDPWGGRALDPSRRAAGTPPSTVEPGPDGSLFLSFTAPIPGRYTVHTRARPGQEGPALITARVTGGAGPARAVWHPNRPAESFGVPAAGSASDG